MRSFVWRGIRGRRRSLTVAPSVSGEEALVAGVHTLAAVQRKPSGAGGTLGYRGARTGGARAVACWGGDRNAKKVSSTKDELLFLFSTVWNRQGGKLLQMLACSKKTRSPQRLEEMKVVQSCRPGRSHFVLRFTFQWEREREREREREIKTWMHNCPLEKEKRLVLAGGELPARTHSFTAYDFLSVFILAICVWGKASSHCKLCAQNRRQWDRYVPSGEDSETGVYPVVKTVRQVYTQWWRLDSIHTEMGAKMPNWKCAQGRYGDMCTSVPF